MHDDQVDQRAPDAVNIPREIGDYQILRVLGVGGMSIVYAALQKQPRRMVALKVMKQGTTTKVSLRRFRREIEILGRLHHPYIAQVFNAGMHDDGSGGVPYFVMEYVPGAKTVLEHVASSSLSVRDTLKLFVKICAAVEHGHHNKVVHRDLKPGNILIDRTRDPKIIDFGVARATEVDPAAATMQTEAGRLVGTVQYMAPEQVDADARDIKPSCDVYALGVLLYKLLTTRYPHSFEGLPIYEAVRIIRMEDPPKPSTINPEVRGDLETILMRCLEKEPARRYQSAGQLGRDVLRYLGKIPIKARPAGFVYRIGLFMRRRKKTLALAAAMCILIVLVAGVTTAIVLSWQDSKNQPEDLSSTDTEPVVPINENDPIEDDANRDEASETTGQPMTTVASTSFGPMIELQNQDQPIGALAFMSSPALLSLAGDHLSSWNYQNQTSTGWPINIAAPVLMVASAPEAQRVAVASGHQKILIIDTETGEVDSTIRNNNGQIQGLGISRDGRLVAYSLDNLTIRIWSKDHRHDRTLRPNSGDVFALCFDASNKLLGGLSNSRAFVYSLADEKVVMNLPGVREPYAITFVGERSLLVGVGGQGVFKMWDYQEGEQIDNLDLMSSKLDAVAFNASGTSLICAAGKRAAVWSLPDRQRSKLPLLPETPSVVAIDEKTRALAFGLANGQILVQPWPQNQGNENFPTRDPDR